MDLTFLGDSVVIPVLGICIMIGFVIKQTLDFVPNKYIPLIMALIGIGLNIWFSNFKFDISILLGGLISGLSSTGFYEMFRNLIKDKDEKNEHKL